MTPIVCGLIAGVAAMLGAGRLLPSQLFGTRPFDPLSFGLTAAAVLLAAVTACLLPAARASKIDPAAALRI